MYIYYYILYLIPFPICLSNKVQLKILEKDVNKKNFGINKFTGNNAKSNHIYSFYLDFSWHLGEILHDNKNLNILSSAKNYILNPEKLASLILCRTLLVLLLFAMKQNNGENLSMNLKNSAESGTQPIKIDIRGYVEMLKRFNSAINEELGTEFQDSSKYKSLESLGLMTQSDANYSHRSPNAQRKNFLGACVDVIRLLKYPICWENEPVDGFQNWWLFDGKCKF